MRALALALTMLSLEACSSDQMTPSSSSSSGAADAAPACPSDLPSACPATVPSYKEEVQGVIVSRCWGCHADGGVAQRGNDLSTYDDIFKQRSAVLNQVYACQMPPSDAGALSPAERAALLAWLVCKAPNN